jgi:hypothetical protein
MQWQQLPQIKPSSQAKYPATVCIMQTSAHSMARAHITIQHSHPRTEKQQDTPSRITRGADHSRPNYRQPRHSTPGTTACSDATAQLLAGPCTIARVVINGQQADGSHVGDTQIPATHGWHRIAHYSTSHSNRATLLSNLQAHPAASDVTHDDSSHSCPVHHSTSGVGTTTIAAEQG